MLSCFDNITHLPNVYAGMFITWCIKNELISDEQKQYTVNDVKKVYNNKMTGGEYIIKNCNEKNIKDVLCELGKNFCLEYVGNREFSKIKKSYPGDFDRIFIKYNSMILFRQMVKRKTIGETNILKILFRIIKTLWYDFWYWHDFWYLYKFWNICKKGMKYKDFFSVEDTWENYERINIIINKRFKKWKKANGI